MSGEGLDDDEAELAAWLEQGSSRWIAPPMEPKQRHRLRSLPGAVLAVFDPRAAVCAMIVNANDEPGSYIALIRNVRDERNRVGSVAFHASNRTLQLDGLEHMDSDVLAALIAEIRTLL